MASQPERVFVVEDQALYRAMLCTYLEAQGYEVAGRASGAKQARHMLASVECDVALIDIGLSDGNGLALGVSLRREHPHLGIVLLSAQNAVEALLDLPAHIREGWCYLSKTSATAGDSLSAAIAAAKRRETMIDPWLLRQSGKRSGSPVANLTNRQYEVLKWVATGMSNQTIADKLEVSTKSVENHLGAIYAALDIPHGQNQRVAAVLQLIEDSTWA